MPVRPHLRAQNIVDASSPKGSEGWARSVLKQLSEAIRYEVNYAHRAWRYIDELEEHDGWRLLRDASGQPFESLQAFVEHPLPQGLGVTIDRIRFIQREHRVATGVEYRQTGPQPGHADAVKDQPRDERGRLKAKSVAYPVRTGAKYGNRAEYLAGRIKAKALKGDVVAQRVADAVLRGEYDSKGMKAAARDAGVLKAPDPVRSATRAVAAVPVDRLIDFIRALDPVVRHRLLLLLSVGSE